MEMKAEFFFFCNIYLIYELRCRSLNLDKFLEQKLEPVLYLTSLLSLLSKVKRKKKTFKKRNFQLRRILGNEFVRSENVS